MKKIFKKKKGFTLVEVVVGVALFSVISMILVSVMVFALKVNYINKDSYDADSYSKTFFETIKTDVARPQKPDATFLTKTYYEIFNNIDEVTTFTINDFSKIKENPLGIKRIPDTINPAGGGTGLADAINHVVTNNTTGGNIALILQVQWDESNNVYQLETWSWNLNKGEATMINRKTLLAPR